MSNSVTGFYDGLAEAYHLLFPDWDAAVRRQGKILDRLIASELPLSDAERGQGGEVSSVLDCSCGIGTQALGLALRGYRVHATDISAGAVVRAEREAARLQVTLTTAVADIRALDTVSGQYDVVLSCDNAVPHLLTTAELEQAVTGMWARLRDGGLLVISLRDYDRLLAERPRSELPRVFDRPDGRQIAFQVWDWAEDAPVYTVHQYIVREGVGSNWQTQHEATTYRALQRRELTAILEGTGFREIRWHEPSDSGYYQPIVAARR